jgi:hypothetical protein
VNDEKPADGAGLSGLIRRVVGRRATDGNGLPAISELVLDLADGRTISALQGPRPGERVRNARLVTAIKPRTWSVCPICLSSGACSREHVPQHDLGGQVMTATCHTCNSRLGSRVEVHLLDWYDNALRAWYEREGIPGRRHGPRVLQLPTTDGEFVHVLDEKFDPAIYEMFTPGEVVGTFQPPVEKLYRLAALKHVYLAACLHFGDIPSARSAERIRGALCVARDASDRRSIPASDDAQRLRILRTYRAPSGPSLALMEELDTNGQATGQPLISLAGTILVSWPFDDLDPLSRPA